MTGASLSVTVTLKLHVTVLPDVSAAVQVTVVWPFGKAKPDAGAHVTVTPGQLSLAVGDVKDVTAAHVPGSVFFAMSPGHWLVN